MSKRIQRKREKNRYVHPNPSRLYIILPENPSTKKEDPQPLAELEITGNVRNLSLSLFQMTHLTSLYLNDNCLRSIPGEVNQLVNLAHLNVAHNQLREIPPQMGDLVSLRELILSHNFLTTLPCEIGKLFKLSKLELEGNPLPNQVLDLWSHSSGIEELLNYLLENLPFNTECPPDRPWIQLLNPNPSVSSCTFTVMCYNVLCDKYATRQLYGYCPNWALDWDYRKKIIMSEILRYKADILSLQEVETEQFYNFFLPELKREGYDGIFSPKSRAKTMSECERKHVDGCAIIFKTNKFFLVKEYLVEFNQLAIANAEGSNDMLNRVMTKDNIGLAALLQTRLGAYAPGSDTARTNQTLLVCTAHIHWDPEYSDVKLIQTMMLMHELQSIVKDTLQKCDNPNVQKDDVNSIPLLLCGDFNSLPNSGVIEFLTSGRVSTKHCDFKQIVYEECLKKLKNSIRSKEFAHPFQISRAYNDEIMPFTNYSYSFKGVIDYVFYSHLHMSILGVLGAIDEKWFRTNKIHGCPHPHVPSDHFPILVELQFAPTEPIHPAPPNGIALHR